MSEPITFWVSGKLAGSGSKSAFRGPGGKIIVTPASKYQKPWQEAVKWAVRQSKYDRMVLLTGPLEVDMVFNFLRPQGDYGTGRNAGQLKDSARKYPHHRPDLDKLVRSTGDALTGLVWRDDSQIVTLTALKVFGGKTGAQITIREL